MGHYDLKFLDGEIESVTRFKEKLTEPNPHDTCSFARHHHDGSECEYCGIGKLQASRYCPAREANFKEYKAMLTTKGRDWRRLRKILEPLKPKDIAVVLQNTNFQF